MTKRILEISHTEIGTIRVGGDYIYATRSASNPLNGLVVRGIEYRVGRVDEEGFYKEGYLVTFENSTKTLEVFDVNYVIRDEE